MTGASKILTVSYGTFSCTLEGFDDPFSTMKAIAEYFRDLAADDRYFGAEPPTPDTAMLHRIAEGATQRRVQAQVQDNGVVLRQGDAIQGDAIQEASAPVAPAPAPALLADDAAKTEADEAAARLARLRAEIDEKSKTIEALEARAAEPKAEPMAELSEPLPNLGTEPAPIAATAAIETLLQGPKDSYLEDSDMAGAAAPINFGAVAGEAAMPKTAELDMAEPDMAEPDTTDMAQSAPRRVIKPDPSTPAQTIRGGEAAAMELAAQSASTSAPTAQTPKFRVEVLRGAQGGAAEAAQPPVTQPPVTQSAAAQPADTAPRARVIRIRRVAQTGGISNAALANPPAAPAPLTPEAEAALTAELAALDAPAPPLSAPAFDSAEPAAPRAKINPSEATLDKLIARANSDLADDEVRRRQAAMAHMKAAAAAKADLDLGAATDDGAVLDTYRQTLDKVAPDGGPRPSPLVLVSEQRIDRTGGMGEAKRSDAPLKLAPSPATPAATTALAENIFLASDDEDDASGPRSNIFTGLETFEDFADRLGASEQVEVMEAAAIYVAHIEKQPLFRRRQLIRHMSSLPDALPMTREASVKIFNQLLSMGRFSEMEPGLFAVTDRSPLLAEALREAI